MGSVKFPANPCVLYQMWVVNTAFEVRLKSDGCSKRETRHLYKRHTGDTDRFSVCIKRHLQKTGANKK